MLTIKMQDKEVPEQVNYTPYPSMALNAHEMFD